ncbi:MAG: type IV toxin-antitoxin system AbiEi family antitoxin [Phycisphaerae bacterium]|nr:type IV toxin-antitoxin system AbiEi family antitoxin [Phycisphaerae bacterium]
MRTKRNMGIEFVRELLRRGYGTFSRETAAKKLGGGPSLSNKLARLADSGWIMPIGRGFYAVIEPGNQGYGFAPPQAFLDDWAKHRGFQYYVGGISAAEIHGAAHQRPQTYQVVVDRALRPFRYGDLRISFFRKTPITDHMWVQKSTPTGYLRVSTPETTAYDLLFLPRACRSLSRVATIFVELGEAMKGPALAGLCAMDCETIPLQRLGWLLDRTGWKKLTGKLHDALKQRKPQWRVLDPRLPEEGKRNDRWHIVENTDVEPDI